MNGPGSVQSGSTTPLPPTPDNGKTEGIEDNGDGVAKVTPQENTSVKKARPDRPATKPKPSAKTLSERLVKKQENNTPKSSVNVKARAREMEADALAKNKQPELQSGPEAKIRRPESIYQSLEEARNDSKGKTPGKLSQEQLQLGARFQMSGSQESETLQSEPTKRKGPPPPKRSSSLPTGTPTESKTETSSESRSLFKEGLAALQNSSMGGDTTPKPVQSETTAKPKPKPPERKSSLPQNQPQQETAPPKKSSLFSESLAAMKKTSLGGAQPSSPPPQQERTSPTPKRKAPPPPQQNSTKTEPSVTTNNSTVSTAPKTASTVATAPIQTQGSSQLQLSDLEAQITRLDDQTSQLAMPAQARNNAIKKPALAHQKALMASARKLREYSESLHKLDQSSSSLKKRAKLESSIQQLMTKSENQIKAASNFTDQIAPPDKAKEKAKLIEYLNNALQQLDTARQQLNQLAGTKVSSKKALTLEQLHANQDKLSSLISELQTEMANKGPNFDETFTEVKEKISQYNSAIQKAKPAKGKTANQQLMMPAVPTLRL
ncbi:hypothetical protein [Parendozoicomonas haliclonae]|uniref:Uncharacterized protein n=1 Tax=Parendozoicomonas haliclonae TaxID=1960125 RepID=A0A1X7AIG3_9GAMM|nr:hypothetical protein [Parendozoicomonas haliclonae]SMA43702.1 hypothetical protein EHSB41UT_01649 [Parendozoicomonas haliclonae]